MCSPPTPRPAAARQTPRVIVPRSDHRYSLLSYFRLVATPSSPSLSIHIFAFHRLSLSPPPQQDVPLCCPEVPGRRGRRVRCERALQQRQERDRDAEAEAGDRPSGGRPRAGASAVLPVSGVRACVANCAALLCKWRSSALYVHRSRSVFSPLLRKKKKRYCISKQTLFTIVLFFLFLLVLHRYLLSSGSSSLFCFRWVLTTPASELVCYAALFLPSISQFVRTAALDTLCFFCYCCFKRKKMCFPVSPFSLRRTRF